MSTLATTTVLGPGVVDEYGNGFGEDYAKTYFYSIYGGDRSQYQADVEEQLGSSAAVITRFSAGVNSRPGGGSWTFSLMRGNTALLTCTVGENDRRCEATGYIPLTPLDRLSIRCAESGAPYQGFSAAAFQITYIAQ
jgi:hypothetical protein